MPGPGTRIDRFVIERMLGRGGMAEVYAARDTQLRRLVALKRLRSDKEDAAATARLLREARAAASFQHPGAVVVYDVFEHDEAAYMAMEMVTGRTLRSYIGDASIPIERRLRWLVDVARALGAAHRAGLVHRDVKPHNVMVRDDGVIKVLDFGIARAHHRAPVGEDTSQSLGTLTETGAVVGTPLYASPEQLSAAAVDERSDQFAWGVMGYELCCGLLPWRRRDTLTMLAQLVAGDIPTMLQRIADSITAHQEASAQGATSRSSPPPPNPSLYADIPPEVELILRRTMRRDPEERYATIDDAADELEELAEAPPSLRYVPRATFPSMDPLGESGARAAAAGTGDSDSGGKGPGATPVSQGDVLARSGSNATPGSLGTARSPGQRARRPEPRDPLPSSPTPISSTPLSTTGGILATGGTAADKMPAEAPPPAEVEELPWWRRPPVLLATFAFVAAGAVGLASALQDPEPEAGGAAGTAAAAASASAAAPATATVDAVVCKPAEVSGAVPAVKDAGALFGQGACVRLAIALGVPWEMSGEGAALGVRVEGGSASHVVLTLGGESAAGDGAKPLAAVDAAVRALSAKVSGRAASAEQQAAIGAADAGAARRVEAILRRRAARLGEDPEAELAEAMTLAPRSPWPRMIALGSATGPAAERLREEVLAATAGLPEPLAEAARGTAFLYAARTSGERDGALPALRRAYAARAEDGLVAAELATALLAAGLTDEAAAIGLRMSERAPPASLAVLARLVREASPDPGWSELRGRLLDRLEALLPESRGWDARALHEALAGRVDEARASLALGDALGLPSATGAAWGRDLGRAAVEIAGGEPAAARKLAQPFLGSPSATEAALAAELLVRGHLLEGHVSDAETTLARDLARLEALGDEVRAANRWVALLRIHRKLGRTSSDFVNLDKLDALVPALEARESATAAVLRAEVFLARLARKERQASDAAEVQSAIEAYAHKIARGDGVRDDAVAAAALPVAQAGSGLSGLRALWRTLDRAPFSAKLPHQLAYGAAAEKDGDAAEAERAYRTVMSAPLSVDGLTHLAARVRLAKLLDESGRKDEAAKVREQTGRLLSGADAGVVDALDHTL